MGEHNEYVQQVYNVIHKYASAESPICSTEIMSKILQDGTGKKCDRKTIERALERLRNKYGKDAEGAWIDDNIQLHYDVIHRKSSPIYKNYWLDVYSEDELSDEELMYLIDAVQYSKHINDRFAGDLIKKLKTIGSASFDKRYSNYRLLSPNTRTLNKDFFLHIGIINEAINKKRMLSFVDNEYGPDKKLHPKGKTIVVNPYKIVVVDGDYYLLCSKKDSIAIKSFRIDKITSIEMISEERDESIAVKDALQNPGSYIVEHRFMKSGSVVEVTIKSDLNVLGDIIDAFGTGIRVEKIPNNNERLIVRLRSGEKDIIDWAVRFGGYAEILSPQYLRKEIENRIETLSHAYRSRHPEEIEYLEAMRSVPRFKKLRLCDIDLNEYDSYKSIENVHRLHLERNHISDFSFLSNYSELKELIIAHNIINDTSVISDLRDVETIGLENTGITDLNFLIGLDHLKVLALHEYTLEDVEAVYDLPNLKSLRVNRITSQLMDKNRLMRVYGKDFKYSVDDSRIMMMVLGVNRSLPPSKRDHELPIKTDLTSFTFFKIDNHKIKEKLSKRINAGGPRNHSVVSASFDIENESCGKPELLELYKNPASYTASDYTWYVTYKDECPRKPSEFDVEKVYCISIFKNDYGLKLIGIASRDSNTIKGHSEHIEAYHESFDVKIAHIKYLIENEIGWAEVNGDLERDFRRISTLDNVINPIELRNHRVYSGLDIDADDYHYYLPDEDGLHTVRRIAYGHIEF